MPDKSWLASISNNITAAIITHAHDDHIGSIHHLWPEVINCPIYATSFCSGVIKSKLKDTGFINDVKINKFDTNNSWSIGNFKFSAVSLSHSTPQSVGLLIEVGGKRIIHTGDWKDDQTPLVGFPTDWKKLDEWSKIPVDMLVCDSTNAGQVIPPTTEMDVLVGLTEVMESRKGMVVVVCFGSNVARIASAGIAASRAGRKTALMGRSIKTNEMIARNLGMMKNIPEYLLFPSHLNGLKRSEMCLVCSGTQGEHNAALSKLTHDEVLNMHLRAGDTVVISARTIPGREENIEDLIDILTSNGIEVLVGKDKTPKGFPLHVTGHAGRDEIERLHKVIKPKVVLAVHGEREHLNAHELIGEMSKTIVYSPYEGDVLELSDTGLSKVGIFEMDIAINNRG